MDHLTECLFVLFCLVLSIEANPGEKVPPYPDPPLAKCRDYTKACQSITTGMCYHRLNRKQCCQACQNLMKPKSEQGCEYGDRSHLCRKLSNRQCYRAIFRHYCCSTCNEHKRKHGDGKKDCLYGNRAETCAPIDKNSNLCYNDYNRHICCKTCSKYEVNIPGCRYGNSKVMFQNELGAFTCDTYGRFFGKGYSCKNKTFRRLCCETCAHVDVSKSRTRFDSLLYKLVY